jgi:hypothetical protein
MILNWVKLVYSVDDHMDHIKDPMLGYRTQNSWPLHIHLPHCMGGYMQGGQSQVKITKVKFSINLLNNITLL